MKKTRERMNWTRKNELNEKVKNENSKKQERMQRRKGMLLKSKKNYTYREENERDCEINDEWFSNEKSGKRN